MKKVLLTAMTLLSVAASSAFGFYGANADWIDLITEGNVLKARVDRFGFALGNGTIKGVFGFKAENGSLGAIFTPSTITEGTETKYFANFTPTVSAGIAYRTDAFGIGVGYNYTYKHNALKADKPGNIAFSKKGIGLSVHTPVITMNFLNDSIRLAVPVQIAMKDGEVAGESDKAKYMGLSLDPQIRYYTGIDAFNEIRLTVKYGMNEFTSQVGEKATVSSVGFDFRAYFGAQVGDVGLKPFLKVVYNTALDKHSSANTGVTAGSAIQVAKETGNHYDSNPWNLEILPTLGMSANSDIVSIYVEAGLGYQAVNTGVNKDKSPEIYGIQHALRWNAYGEVYVRPIQDLEWYFEAEIGNSMSDSVYGDIGMGGVYAGYGNSVQLNASTGLNWYLPSFGGDAQ